MSTTKTTKKNDNKVIKVKVTKIRSSLIKEKSAPTIASKPVTPVIPKIVTPTKSSLSKKRGIYLWQHAIWFTGLLITILLIITAMIMAPLTYNVKLPTTPIVNNSVLLQSQSNTLTSILTGELIMPEVAERRPLAVVVENYPTSRPQAGLSFADLVWEAPTEGGITRFLAIFQKGLPAKIGPVRSARSYFIDWVREVAGFYAHSGGSPEALAILAKGVPGVQDVNEFSYSGAYWREENESKPHNLYTSATRFYDYAMTQNWPVTNSLQGWLYHPTSDIKPQLVGEVATQVLVPYYPLTYDVLWKYQENTGVYLRSMDGKAHLDKITNQQLQVKNLIVMFTDITPIPKDPLLRVNIKTIGSGRVYLFVGGKVYQGKWYRDNLNSTTKFLAEDGSYLPLLPGNIWISVMDKPQEQELEYK